MPQKQFPLSLTLTAFVAMQSCVAEKAVNIFALSVEQVLERNQTSACNYYNHSHALTCISHISHGHLQDSDFPRENVETGDTSIYNEWKILGRCFVRRANLKSGKVVNNFRRVDYYITEGIYGRINVTSTGSDGVAGGTTGQSPGIS